jgi:hypothetical protein
MKIEVLERKSFEPALATAMRAAEYNEMPYVVYRRGSCFATCAERSAPKEIPVEFRCEPGSNPVKIRSRAPNPTIKSPPIYDTL